jgi:hypothetical protein
VEIGYDGRARTCVASVRPDNARSLALIRAFGFRRAGQRVDEIDGLEWVFELRLPARNESGRPPGQLTALRLGLTTPRAER